MNFSDAHSTDAAAQWATPSGFRQNNFDACRLLLGCLVIVSHAYPLTLGGNRGQDGVALEPLVRVTDGVTLGSLAVYSFFAISGFLIAHSLAFSRGLGDYLWKRVVRIYPAFLVATVVSLGVVMWAGGGEATASIYALAKSGVRALFLLTTEGKGAFENQPLPNAVNGSMWSIRYEFACYLGLAGVWLLGWRSETKAGRWSTLLALILMLAITTAVTALRVDVDRVKLPLYELSNVLLVVPYFVAGVAFHAWRALIPQSAWLGAGAWGVLALGLMGPRMGEAGQALLPLVGPVALCYVLMSLCYSRRVRLHRFGRFGDFSYGTYLYAFPIQQLLIFHGVATTPWLNAGIAVPLSILAGVVSWHAVEKHALKLKRTTNRPLVTRPTGSTAIDAEPAAETAETAGAGAR